MQKTFKIYTKGEVHEEILENRHKNPQNIIKASSSILQSYVYQILVLPVWCYLPELFQFVDLLSGDLACPELLLFRRDLHQPGQKAPILDQRLPLGAVPVNVLQTALTGTWLPKHTNTPI